MNMVREMKRKQRLMQALAAVAVAHGAAETWRWAASLAGLEA